MVEKMNKIKRKKKLFNAATSFKNYLSLILVFFSYSSFVEKFLIHKIHLHIYTKYCIVKTK